MDATMGSIQRCASAVIRFFQFYWMTLGHLRILKRNLQNGKIKEQSVVDDQKIIWSKRILQILRIQLKVTGQENLQSERAALFVGNHISYLDIPVLFSVVPVAFVAKEELASWPIIGSCIRSAGMLLVKREDSNSRRATAKAVAKEVLECNRPVAIFPSGTTTVDESKPWRFGAFKIAHEHRVPVQPFRLRFSPLRKSAYIDDDAFLPHFFRLLCEPKIIAELEFGEPFFVDDVVKAVDRCQGWAQEFVQAVR